MQKKTVIRKVRPLQTAEQWQLHRNIAQYALSLNREKNAADIRKDKPQSVPLAMLGMVF